MEEEFHKLYILETGYSWSAYSTKRVAALSREQALLLAEIKYGEKFANASWSRYAYDFEIEESQELEKKINNEMDKSK